MEGSRLRILQLLQRSGNDTVNGLATTIGLAQATIRRHLDILQRGRLVAFDEVRKKTGRPEYSFYLTEDGQEALPKGYDLLLNMLVQELAAMPAEDTNGRAGSEILELVFHRLSDKVWQRYESTVGGEDLESRLSTLMGLLRQEQFSSEAEVVDDILRIKLLNCPFRSVALRNNAVCSFDSNLIASMLELQPVRETCIHDGDTGCVYSAQLDWADAGKLSVASKG